MWREHLRGREIGWRQGRADYDPEKPSFLMIHGAGGSSLGYTLQLRDLDRAGICNPASLDLPGHGDTPGPAPKSIDEYAAWLAEFLSAGPVRPVIMGHSMGGAICMTLALNYPELLSGLVLFATGCRLKVLPAILQGIQADFLPTVKMIVRTAHGENPDPRMVEQGVEHMAATGPEVLLSDFQACDNFDLCGNLEQINLPTLVLVGDQDKMSPQKYSRFLVEHIPGAQMMVVPGGGHMVNLEQPQAFNQALAGFLTNLTGNPAWGKASS